MYWNLVFAYENVKVQQEALVFAQKTMSDTQKQVQIGSMAPIQVVGAQSTVATDQQALILAQTNLEQQELLMKNALSRTLVDPVLAEAEVIPTSDLQLPAQEPVIPTQDLINDALNHRAELAESKIDLTSRDISNKAVRNALRPTLNLFAYYGGSGLGGDINPNAQLCSATNPSAFCLIVLRKPIRFGRNWNFARPKCGCNRLKIKSASKSGLRNSPSSKIARVSKPRRHPRNMPGKPWMPSRKNWHWGLQLQPWCYRISPR